MGNAFSCIEMHKEGWDYGHHAITKAHQSPADAPPHDMTLPLSHYFISSGHNSYLTGNQLNSSSGVTTIITCLQKNCRVIELDVYNQQGDFSGPVCKHGGTLTTPVAFKDCIEAVAKHAFDNSPYPVIITLENHTDEANQAVMAEILISCLGQALYIPNPEEELAAWKSPEELKHKVLIRANPGKSAPELKRLIYINNTKFKSLKEANDAGKTSSSSFDEVKAKKLLKKVFEASGLPTKASANASQSSKKLAQSASGKVPGKPKPVKGAVPTDSIKLPKPGPEEARVKAGALLEKPEDDIPEEALNSVYSLGELYAYTATNLMRVYPGGMRVDSSNYNPTSAWSAGASFVALNWQTWDQALWLNSALFALNGGCGYVLKPKWMRSLRESINGGAGTSQTNPLPEPANRTLSITVHSAYVQQSGRGKFACLKDDVYVQVELLGMPMDNQQQKSPVAQNTGRLLVNETYTFNVAYPEMGILLLKVKDEDLPGATQMDNLLGHWEVALSNLSEGTFKVTLMDRKGKHRHDRWIKITVQWITPDFPPPSPGAVPAPSAAAGLPAPATAPAADAAGVQAGPAAGAGVAGQPMATTVSPAAGGSGAAAATGQPATAIAPPAAAGGVNEVANPLSTGMPAGAAESPPGAERVSSRERKRME